MTTSKQISDMSIRFIFALLTITASGVGWLIVQNNVRLNQHDERLHKVETDINDLKNISRNVVEAYNGKADKDKMQDSAIEKQRDEILELWKCAKRSGAPVNMTLKE